MTDGVFNSTFEMEPRILMLLSAAQKKAFSLERIVSLDFIVCYAARFQLPFLNLQGDNRLMFSELASRRARIQGTVKNLVVQGLLDVSMNNGYEFRITDAGKKFTRKLESDYATQYREIAVVAVKRFKNYSDLELDRMINDSAVKMARGDR